MDINAFSNVRGSFLGNRVVVDGRGESVRAMNPTGGNKVVAWLQSKFADTGVKQRQNTEVRQHFADALKREFGGVIGEGFAADIRQAGNKPLTTREIRATIADAKAMMKSNTDALLMKQEYFAGSGDAKEAFAANFDRKAEQANITAGGGALRFSDFATDKLREKIGWDVGGVNLKLPEASIKSEYKTAHDAHAYQGDRISAFIDRKKDALAAVTTRDPAIRTLMEDIIKGYEGVGPDTVKIVETLGSKLGASLEGLAEHRFNDEAAVGLMVGLRREVAGSIDAHMRGLSSEDQRAAKVDDQDVMLGALRVAIALLGDAKVNALEAYLSSDGMKAIVGFTKDLSTQNFAEMSDDSYRWPQEDPVWSKASSVGSAHQTLQNAIVFHKTGSMPVIEQRSSLEALVNADNTSARPLLADQPPRIVEMMSAVLDAPFLEMPPRKL